ncbi:hypothetical protein B0T17DRAFT_510357 [Bombardia bombarda]|uniref:Uncharacterized protein n=1 Tax=Bombardia bombarda TaxID=252184 RepID=A0AA39WI16_9PEZI|nr:hypothetical protein B0T17DRAFT_510357 [Bombardia bombarda]
MSKNADITSFFKRVPKNSQSPRSQSHSQPQAPSQTVVASRTSPRISIPSAPTSSPPLFPSSPLAPLQSSVRSRDAVILGSDDENGDDDDLISSDDDLPSLFDKPAVVAVPVPPARKGTHQCHKFDIKALMKDAEADSALEASEQRTALESATTTAVPAYGGLAAAATERRNGTTSLHNTMLDVFSDPEGSHDEPNREKLLRAVRRTEATVHQKVWYFFDQEEPDHRGSTGSGSIEDRHPFPQTAAKGPWKFLAPAKSRAELFEDGVPYHIQAKLQSLPDEIFLWILNEVPTEKSRTLREEYLRVLSVSLEQAGRLMDKDLIVQLFRDMGAAERALDSLPSMAGRPKKGGPYNAERDWTTLRSLLRIMSETSAGLEFQSLIQSMALLLRLGMDNLVREDLGIARDYQDALSKLAQPIPSGSWDSFCGDVCMSLYGHIHEATLRWDAVSSIPLTHPRLIDLRRRLALVCVFDDPHRARSRPEESFTMRAVLDRLEADEFIIDRNYTDFYELAALTDLLSVAIGDGCPPPAGAGPDAVRQYNADVDKVAERLKIMWSNIHEQGAAFVSRLEARVKLKDLERKLQHVTRTRPPPKQRRC